MPSEPTSRQPLVDDQADLLPLLRETGHLRSTSSAKVVELKPGEDLDEAEWTHDAADELSSFGEQVAMSLLVRFQCDMLLHFV